MKDIGAIPFFITVIEQGSFSKAASKLGVTKSAVSKRISGLEAELGVKLLYRSTRQLSLTEAGERYSSFAMQAFQAAEAAENAATELQQVPKGTLRVSTPMAFGRLYLSPLIPDFLKRYPDIELKLEMNDAWSDLIADGFDVALRGGELVDSSLRARQLTVLQSVICAAPEYLEQHGPPLTPQELTKHNCMLYSHQAVVNEWRFSQGITQQSVRVKGNYQVNNAEALHEALLQGAGIGRLPTFIAGKDIRAGRLIPVLTDYELPAKPLYVLFPEKRYMPVKVRVFIDFLVERLVNDSPNWDIYKS